MGWLIRGLFQPTENRYWLGTKLHTLRYVIYNVPPLILIGVLFAINPSMQLLAFGGVFILFTLLDYFVFDKMLDKFFWHFFLKRHYDYKSPHTSEEHQLIKQYEAHPSPENHQAIREQLKK